MPQEPSNSPDDTLQYLRAKPIAALFDAPTTLVFLLRHLFYKTAGEAWFKAGFNIATGFLGPFAITLHGFSRNATGPIAWSYRLAAWIAAAFACAWFALGGYWALALIPMLRIGKHLPVAAEETHEPEWREKPLRFTLEKLDYISLAFIALFTLIMLLALPHLYPKPPDAYYHIQVAQSIAEHKTIPLWDDWSYAPDGRPHLYPPLFHVLLYSVSFITGGDLIRAMNLLNALWPIAIYLSTWYFARWLFDARHAFIALLLIGANFDIMTIAWRTLPSLMAGNLVLFTIVFFLKNKPILAAICAAAGLYFHPGITPLSLVGLALFAFMNRAYVRPLFICLGVTLLLYAPWLLQVLTHLNWFNVPNAPPPDNPWMRMLTPFENLFWLLAINLVLALLVARGLQLLNWTEKRNQILLATLLAFLPMFINYGGRYFMHTAQLWVIIAALPLAHFLNPPLQTRRIALCILLAFCPILLFTGPAFGPGPHIGGPLGFMPMVSAWTFPIFEAAGAREFLRDRFDLEPNSYEEAQEVADYIQRNTSPDQIVHHLHDVELALRVAPLAQRSMSDAGWSEVCPPPEILQQHMEKSLRDPQGIFLTTDAETKSEAPKNIAWKKIGRIHVGLPPAP